MENGKSGGWSGNQCGLAGAGKKLMGNESAVSEKKFEVWSLLEMPTLEAVWKAL